MILDIALTMMESVGVELNLHGTTASTTEAIKSLPVTKKASDFDRWFGKSKIVDRKKQPLLVYHGTAFNNQIKRFKSAGSHNLSWAGKDLKFECFYFTDGYDVASTYGRVVSAYLSIQNPKIFNARGKSWDDYHPIGKITETVATGQYDGVIFRNISDEADGGGQESTVYVVFSPDQIRIVDQSFSEKSK